MFESTHDATIISPVDGIVLEVKESGTKSGVTVVAMLAGCSGGFRASTQIPAADAHKLPGGTQVYISTSSGTYAADHDQVGMLLSVSASNSEGQFDVLVKLPDGQWKHGQNVRLELVISKDHYQSCMPLFALRQG